MTSSLKKRFVKDHKLPIAIFKEPYFSYYLDIYEDLFKSQTLYNEFVSVVLKFGGESGFFEESKRIQNEIISDIGETHAYLDFISCDMAEFKTDTLVSEGNLYNANNHNKFFVSIDLKQANFNVLKSYNSDIVFNCEDYEELLSKYTLEDYFFKSKHVRQIIFGHLNPKRQRRLQKFTIQSKIIPIALDLISSDLTQYKTASDDEVVIELDETSYNNLGITFDELSTVTGVPVNLEKFKIKQLGDKPFFVKEFEDGTYAFKAVPANYFAECYKYYLKKPLTECDLCTYIGGRLVNFLEPLFE